MVFDRLLPGEDLSSSSETKMSTWTPLRPTYPTLSNFLAKYLLCKEFDDLFNCYFNFYLPTIDQKFYLLNNEEVLLLLGSSMKVYILLLVLMLMLLVSFLVLST